MARAKAGGIAVRGLTKRYRTQTAVEGASFDVPRGAVTGFFGPNGSGKTTTMRAMLGLARADSGTTAFDGLALDRVPNLARTAGAVLDAATLHAGRTVAQTMRLVCLTAGLEQRRGDGLIEEVGLAGARRRRVGRLSLGMRQRLALAAALAGDPDYLLLDEPMNGLDPEGIAWLRGLMADLARAGKGILVSTHLIGEIDDLAEHVVLINRGRLAAAEEKARLLGTAQPQTLVRSVDNGRLGRALAACGIAVNPDGPVLRCHCESLAVARAAYGEGILLLELRPVEASLRDLVLARTQGEHRSLGAAPKGDLAQGTVPGDSAGRAARGAGPAAEADPGDGRPALATSWAAAPNGHRSAGTVPGDGGGRAARGAGPAATNPGDGRSAPAAQEMAGHHG